jgi:hypothetical protein
MKDVFVTDLWLTNNPLLIANAPRLSRGKLCVMKWKKNKKYDEIFCFAEQSIGNLRKKQMLVGCG